MYGHYLSLAVRHLARNPIVSLINIVGLAIGLAATIMIMMYVREQLSYDTFWPNGDRLVRVETDLVMPGEPTRFSSGAVDPLKDIFLDRYDQVEAATRAFPINVTTRMDDILRREEITFVETNYFDILEHSFVEGDAATALEDPQAVILTESAARRHLGEGPWLGRSIEMNVAGFEFYRVAAVVRDLPETTVVGGDIYALVLDRYFENWRVWTKDWRFPIRHLYLKLRNGDDAIAINQDTAALIDQHMPKGQHGMEGGEHDMVLTLRKMAELFMGGNNARGDYETTIGFAVIALVILFIALANFINLSIAQATKRTREAAVRKVVGASVGDFWRQFVFEVMVIVSSALMLAYVLVEVFMPTAKQLLSSLPSMSLLSSPGLLGLSALAMLVVGLSVGALHAGMFARVKSADVLKGQVVSDGGKSPFKVALVVAQFSVAIALMTVSLVILQQTTYSQQLRLGFNKENLLLVHSTNGDDSDRIKARLLENPAIVAVGRSSDAPTQGSEDRLIINSVDGTPVTLDGLPTDQDFFKVYQIPMVAGRALDELSEADVLRPRDAEGNPMEYQSAAGFIVNRMGAELLGYKDPFEAVGQTVRVNLSSSLQFDGRIVRISEDFHFDSSRNVIRPGIYYLDKVRLSHMAVRMAEGREQEALAHLQDVWAEFRPNTVLRYNQMTDLVADQYSDMIRLGDTLTVFTVLAVTLAVLGLYGMASLSAARRIKEIGIRRVLGASRLRVTAMIMWQFSKPVLIAILLAWPAAAYFLMDWLEGYAYRIDLSPVWFAITGVAALLLAWSVIGLHVWRISGSAPVMVLRHD